MEAILLQDIRFRHRTGLGECARRIFWLKGEKTCGRSVQIQYTRSSSWLYRVSLSTGGLIHMYCFSHLQGMKLHLITDMNIQKNGNQIQWWLFHFTKKTDVDSFRSIIIRQCVKSSAGIEYLQALDCCPVRQDLNFKLLKIFSTARLLTMCYKEKDPSYARLSLALVNVVQCLHAFLIGSPYERAREQQLEDNPLLRIWPLMG